MTTMLSLVQQAAGELGIAVPVSVVGNPSADPLQLLYLANACGYELQRKHQWQALNKTYIFTVAVASLTGTTVSASASITLSATAGLSNLYGIAGPGINQATYLNSIDSGTTATLSQPATSSNTGATYSLCKVKYPMPSDYDRMIDDTQWDKSKHWRMLGPETAQQWEWLISGYISTGPRIRWRIFGSYLQIWPMVGTAEVLGFEYVSNAWAASSGGVAQTSFTADTDTCIFNDRLMVLFLKKKYMEIKGMDTTIIARDYMDELNLAQANDSGSPTLSMAPLPTSVLITEANLPDSGIGL